MGLDDSSVDVKYTMKRFNLIYLTLMTYAARYLTLMKPKVRSKK